MLYNDDTVFHVLQTLVLFLGCCAGSVGGGPWVRQFSVIVLYAAAYKAPDVCFEVHGWGFGLNT